MIYSYRTPTYNEQILIGADPAEGNDYSTFVAISKRTADVIMIGKAKQESPLLGYTLNHVGLYFKKLTGLYPLIAPERNTGSACIHKLKELNYPNIYKAPKTFDTIVEETGEKYGWVTSSSTRPKMLDELALAIRTKSITIPSKPVIDELFTFIRREKDGKPIAENGCNDDLVMALAIAWQLYENSAEQTIPDVLPANFNDFSQWKIGGER